MGCNCLISQWRSFYTTPCLSIRGERKNQKLNKRRVLILAHQSAFHSKKGCCGLFDKWQWQFRLFTTHPFLYSTCIKQNLWLFFGCLILWECVHRVCLGFWRFVIVKCLLLSSLKFKKPPFQRSPVLIPSLQSLSSYHKLNHRSNS